MRAMVFRGSASLELEELAEPTPGPEQLRVRVLACGVCRTDLHVVDGDLSEPRVPVIPGHQIVGEVDQLGPGVSGHAIGDRVGIPWLGHTCGGCSFCLAGRENLCSDARFTGYQIDGGFADYAVADADFAFPLPADLPADRAAPLLCAGLIGYRALRMTGDGSPVGLYGFGSAAHIAAQVLRHQGRSFFAFTRPGDTQSQSFARELGADWAGDSEQSPPRSTAAAIIFAPVGSLVPTALSHLQPGGTVVCAGIHMSDIPSFPYASLWGERVIRSVANLTRQDGEEFLPLAAAIPIRTSVTVYPLEEANRALDDLRHGRFDGSAVLRIAD